MVWIVVSISLQERASAVILALDVDVAHLVCLVLVPLVPLDSLVPSTRCFVERGWLALSQRTLLRPTLPGRGV